MGSTWFGLRASHPAPSELKQTHKSQTRVNRDQTTRVEQGLASGQVPPEESKPKPNGAMMLVTQVVRYLIEVNVCEANRKNRLLPEQGSSCTPKPSIQYV